MTNSSEWDVSQWFINTTDSDDLDDFYFTYNITEWPENGNMSFGDNTTAIMSTTTARRYYKYNWRCGHDYTFAMRGVVLGFIIAFGIVGNILSALVMRHDIRTSATSLLFFVLAMVDIVVLISRLFLVTIPEILIYFQITGRDYTRFQKNYVEAYGQAFAFMTQHWTAGMTVLVTTHRYMVVCKPTKTAKFVTVKAVIIQIVVILVAIFIYNIPLFMEWKVIEYYRRGKYTYKKRPTDMARSDSYTKFYRIAMLYLMLYVIPVSLLVVFSYQLIVTVKRAQEKLNKMSNRKREKHDMTKTLVAIIICFVICQLPTPTDILIRELTDRKHRRCPYFVFYFGEFVDVGICFNSAFNFVLYCLFGKRFRRHLKSLLCGHKVRIQPLEPTIEVTQTTQVASTQVASTDTTNIQMISKSTNLTNDSK